MQLWVKGMVVEEEEVACFSSVSMPPTTRPNTVCLLSRPGHGLKVM